MSQPITLYWVRQDLRLQDNPALSFAASQGPVLAVYILDDQTPDLRQPGGASCWWLHNSLTRLNQKMQGNLHFLKGRADELLGDIINRHDIQQVVWNRRYEPGQIEQDKQIKSQLADKGIKVKSFNSNLLWEPWTVTKQDGSPYKVFTPYYRKGCLSQPAPRYPTPVPENLMWLRDDDSDSGLDAFELLPDIKWYQTMQNTWKPGEEGASENLSRFLRDAVRDYKDERNIPSRPGTSNLSPHLHFGEISPNQVWYAAIDALNGNIEQAGLDCYLSELGWREFSHYLLYHFPNLPTENFAAQFNTFPWRKDHQSLRAWQQGNTGIPIIDAGMRELWQTGYMHNRVRMVVASFLVKNLLIDWREGERWFWDCLLDADLAANSASWQWVAGCGADAAPYFRIFNPVLQGEKFDKNGDYVRHYCPELSAVPDKYIHAPWQAPTDILDNAGVILGETYPHPVVDLKASRQRALDALATTKKAKVA